MKNHYKSQAGSLWPKKIPFRVVKSKSARRIASALPGLRMTSSHTISRSLNTSGDEDDLAQHHFHLKMVGKKREKNC